MSEPQKGKAVVPLFKWQLFVLVFSEMKNGLGKVMSSICPNSNSIASLLKYLVSTRTHQYRIEPIVSLLVIEAKKTMEEVATFVQEESLKSFLKNMRECVYCYAARVATAPFERTRVFV